MPAMLKKWWRRFLYIGYESQRTRSKEQRSTGAAPPIPSIRGIAVFLSTTK